MTIAKIEGHLRETIGLDAASIGPSSIDRAVRSRMIACNESDTGNYWDRIQASSAEAQELIEAVVVSETWFFRDRGAFASLTRFVESEWSKFGKKLRLLSIPCATGEEPYSMAMALLDIGLTGKRFQIDAVDISARALRKRPMAAIRSAAAISASATGISSRCTGGTAYRAACANMCCSRRRASSTKTSSLTRNATTSFSAEICSSISTPSHRTAPWAS